MKKIIVVCAGGYGREVFELIEDINENAIAAGEEPPYDIMGFINDDLSALDGKKIDAKIIGTIKDWEPYGDEVYALGLANPKDKEKIVNILKNRGARFETLISPRCRVSKTAKIGEGCIIKEFIIGQNVVIGNYVNIMGSMIGQDSIIGDYSTTTGFVNIACAELGKRVFVGSNSVILNGKKIGNDAFVATGSIVARNVKPGYKVFGNPAQKVDW